eukprot:885699-Pelagomonas_calceolata.AAC.2
MQVRVCSIATRGKVCEGSKRSHVRQQKRVDEVRREGQAVLPDRPLNSCLHSEEAHNRTSQEVGEGFQGRD